MIEEIELQVKEINKIPELGKDIEERKIKFNEYAKTTETEKSPIRPTKRSNRNVTKANY